MRKRIFALLPTTFLLLAPLAGAEPGIVSESAETIRYREVDGTETLLTKHPRRTIVGNASFADPWFTAGARRSAVSRRSRNRHAICRALAYSVR